MPAPQDSRRIPISTIARNTQWNLLGFGIPLVVAVFAIPLLIEGLGNERFGVLTIGWALMGYFALFDLGMSRAATKLTAEHVERAEIEKLPPLIWGLLVAHAALGLLGASIWALLVPWLNGQLFEVPGYLATEVSQGFYLLALSVLLIVPAACLRGVLEGVRRFDLVNAVKIPAGMMNYLGPLIVLQFTNHLAALIGFIVVVRLITLVMHFVLFVRIMPGLASDLHVDFGSVLSSIRFGGWLTVSSLTTPVIVLIDRFVIGALISIGALAYYVTPYEVITKLWIFSASLLSVLFPVFSALSVNMKQELRSLCCRASKFLLVIVAPIVVVLLTFSEELLALWINSDFAAQSATVARWLTVGVFINILAQVPFTVMQGIGRADLVAKIQLFQLPFYVLAAWYLGQAMGIAGVAVAWTLRTIVDLLLLSLAADRLLPEGGNDSRCFSPEKAVTFCLSFAAFWSLGLASISMLKLVGFLSLLSFFMWWEWRFVFADSDRLALISGTKQITEVVNWNTK